MKTLLRKPNHWSIRMLEYWAHYSMIPIFHYSILILSVVSVFLFPMRLFAAESVRFRHALSIYLDEKGVGMKQPEGIAWDGKSLLIVADTGNGRLLQFTIQDRTVRGGKEIKIPQLTYPIRVEVNSRGEMFALDGKQRRIIHLSPTGEYKGNVASEGIRSPTSFVPRSFKIDSKDNLSILDIFGGRVIRLDPGGKYQGHVNFPEDNGFFSDLAVDFRGNVLVVDSVKATVFSAPKDSNAFSPLTKSLRKYLNFPTSMATDSRGTIYLVDQNGGGIVILSQDGSYLGRQLTMGWNEGQLYYPSQISVAEKGEVFIADRGNNRIQMFRVIR